jgi:hypothetical protein
VSRFIRNTSSVVAWDHQIPSGSLFARTVIGAPRLPLRGDAAPMRLRRLMAQAIADGSS